MTDNLSPQPRDNRMRVRIPYSLKYGLATDMIVCEESKMDSYTLNAGFMWVEFVAVNDPLTVEDEPCPHTIGELSQTGMVVCKACKEILNKETDNQIALRKIEKYRRDIVPDEVIGYMYTINQVLNGVRDWLQQEDSDG